MVRTAVSSGPRAALAGGTAQRGSRAAPASARLRHN